MSPRRTSAVCVPNIGAKGRRRRFVQAVVWLGLSAVAAVTLVVAHVATPWGLLLAIPFALAAVFYFQARERT